MNRRKEMLLASGALFEGHFVYASGRHGGYYVNKTVALVTSRHAQMYARDIVEYYSHLRLGIETVVGPELGAITLMTRVADQLQERSEKRVHGVIATKVPGSKPTRFEISRGQEQFVHGKRVLIVEDIITTGGSVAAAVESVIAAGGEPVGIGALWNRGGIKAQALGVDILFSCIDEEIEDYNEKDCPLCAAQVPINTDLGKGAQYLEEKGRAR